MLEKQLKREKTYAMEKLKLQVYIMNLKKEISLMNSFVQKASALGFRCEVTSRVENCVKKRLYI